jgi:hypothetical protein
LLVGEFKESSQASVELRVKDEYEAERVPRIRTAWGVAEINWQEYTFTDVVACYRLLDQVRDFICCT